MSPSQKTLLLVLLMAVWPVETAGVAMAQKTDGNKKAAEQTATSVRFDQVVPARQMILRRVEDRHGVLLGDLADIVLDRSHGRVAFFAINSRRAPNTRPNNYFVPPAAVNQWTADGRLRLNVSIQDVEALQEIVDPVPATFADSKTLRMLYEHFDASPYWDAKQKEQRMDVITVDELDGRIVRDTSWNKLGRVEEILLAPQEDWKVAYLAVSELRGESPSPDRLAVPMAAFAIGTLSPTWLLDVPRESELLNATFEAGEWPREIHRGWIEFTHVKYGQDALGGVQKLNAEQNGASE